MKTIKTTILFTLLALLNMHSARAGNSKELKAAETTLIHYLKAGDNSNIADLEKLMHTNYRVIFKDSKKDEVSEISRDSYLEFIEKKIFGGKERSIKSINGKTQGNTIASFEIITVSEAGVMTSFYSLVKEKGKWYVVQDLVYM